jgi:hypothetical protein
VARVLLALFLGWMCVMVTCASGPLGGPATITAAHPVKAGPQRASVQVDDGGGPQPAGFPVVPRLLPLLAALVGLLLALTAVVARVAPTDAPEPHRRWRAPDPPRRGPPLLLVP